MSMMFIVTLTRKLSTYFKRGNDKLYFILEENHLVWGSGKSKKELNCEKADANSL